MEKYIYNEQNGLHYELIGDYYYPCLTVPEPVRVGIWGMRRHRYRINLRFDLDDERERLAAEYLQQLPQRGKTTRNRFAVDSIATLRWSVAATSSKTGGYFD